MKLRPVVIGILIVMALGIKSGVAHAFPFQDPNYSTHTRWGKLLAPLSACPDGSLLTDSSSAQVANMDCLIAWARHRDGLGIIQSVPELQTTADLTARAIVRCGGEAPIVCHHPMYYYAERAHYSSSSFDAGISLVGSFLLGRVDFASSRRVMMAWLNDDASRYYLLSKTVHQFGVSEITPLRWKYSYDPAEIWIFDVGR